MTRESRINAAMQHPDRLGAGAAKRRHLKPSERGTAVMKEFARGTLRSGGGSHVTSAAQARAIASSESKKRR
jgi:hypothetical protein